MESIKVLLIEDNPGDFRLIQEMFKESKANVELKWAKQLSTGSANLKEEIFDALLVDLGLPDSQGIDTFKKIHAQVPQIPIVVLTGLADDGLATRAVREGAQDYLVKGQIDSNLLIRALRYAIERKRAEEELRESEKRYRAVTNSAIDSIITVNDAGIIIGWNQGAQHTFGFNEAEILGQSLEILMPESYRDRHTVGMKRIQKCGELHVIGRTVELEGKRKDGSEFPLELSLARWETAKGSFFTGIIRDITHRKLTEKEKAALQEQLRQSQKMEAIGQLAGGISHDFNNLLTVISGNCQLFEIELTENDPQKECLKEVIRAAERASGLTRQLLAFSRRQILEMKVLDLNGVLRNLDKMLHRVIGEDIDMMTLLDEDLGRVKADPGQIEQIMMNLVVNARDAMPSGGKLTIETANVEQAEEYARDHVSVIPGRYVMVSVSDTGVGMSQDIQEKVFEPFFTTKERGKGTGLGLSTVYGIVKQSGGNIWVYSEPGQGTVFKIYLPRVDEPLEEETERAAVEKHPKGIETILLVEDDEKVREVTIRILKKGGYRVLIASKGDEALQICKEHVEPIHLMLTDVVMPGMSGKELAGFLENLNPGMKVLYMSGYEDDAILHHGILNKGMNYIQKPFTIEGLSRKVREVLDH